MKQAIDVFHEYIARNGLKVTPQRPRSRSRLLPPLSLSPSLALSLARYLYDEHALRRDLQAVAGDVLVKHVYGLLHGSPRDVGRGLAVLYRVPGQRNRAAQWYEQQELEQPGQSSP